MKYVQINNLEVTIENQEILKGANLSLEKGALTALIGRNGAGKSTFLKALLGEVPYKGTISYQALSESKADKPVIGYIPQKLLFDLSSPISVLDIFAATQSKWPVWFGVCKKVRENVKNSLRKLDADYLLDRQLGVLSGGELQRVLLALALQPMPDVLLLDEPVAGMDQNGLKLFYKMVRDLAKKHKLTILLISHDLDLVAEYADKVAFLSEGSIKVYDTPRRVFENEEVRKQFGLSFGVKEEKKERRKRNGNMV